MRPREPSPDDTPLPEGYADLLGEAADVAARAVGRLHDLRGRYPADLPPPVIGQIDRAHADPAAERRGAVRLPADPDVVAVRSVGGPEREATVLDRSPGGLSLRLGVMVLPGAVLGVQLHRGAEWLRLEVRYARPDRGAWVVGCGYVGEPPIA
jgi:hypothetical protein